jgi:hypothetical protein
VTVWTNKGHAHRQRQFLILVRQQDAGGGPLASVPFRLSEDPELRALECAVGREDAATVPHRRVVQGRILGAYVAPVAAGVFRQEEIGGLAARFEGRGAASNRDVRGQLR